ncbi:MAG: alpha/beta hydrolase [Eubacterium sp.]|nr:alpha/beta hydrolase [Eubacterium sp.]
MKKKLLAIPLIIFIIIFADIILFIVDYYHATDDVKNYMNKEGDVKVAEISEGLFIDGPGTEGALIFYPGARVEYTSYLPLLYKVAEGGIDCFLVEMPVNVSLLNQDAADDIIENYDYEKWYLGGHSLGGVSASMYAAGHELDGMVFLASYPFKPIDEPALEMYGSNDKILKEKKRSKSDKNLSADSVIEVIEGGNHAQFGNYGKQRGDGEASISRDKQQEITAQRILEFFDE